MKSVLLIIFIVFLCSIFTFAHASIPLRFSLGAGGAIKNNIRKDNLYKKGSDDVLISAIPLIQIAYGPIFVGQQGLTLSFLGNREKSAYFNINRGGDRYDGDSMISRQTSWFAGFGIKYDKFNVLISKDIDGRSHGVRSSLSYTEIYTIREKFFTRSSVGIEYLDQKYAEYYYGVRSFEASLNRPEYHPKAILNATLSFFPGYKFNEKLSTLTGIALKYLDNDIYLSPTTKNIRLETTLISGLLWQF